MLLQDCRVPSDTTQEFNLCQIVFIVYEINDVEIIRNKLSFWRSSLQDPADEML